MSIIGSTNAQRNVATWISHPRVTPNGRRISPATRMQATASPEPTSRYAPDAGSPFAAPRVRATSAPRKTITDWAASTTAPIRQVNFPVAP